MNGLRGIVLVAGLIGAPAMPAALAQQPSLSPGDAVSLDGLSVLVPPPGRGVSLEVLRADGTTGSLGVLTAGNGAVSVIDDPATTAQAALGTPEDEVQDVVDEVAACRDDAYQLESWKRSSRHRWFYRSANRPAGLTSSEARLAILAGANTITGAKNNCGLPDQVSARHTYAGSTTRGTNITSTSACANEDGVSVVSFGVLPAGVLATTCVWYQLSSTPHEVTSSDIRLNRAGPGWFTVRPVPCDGVYDLESVAAHEFGHVFGLGHVSEADHAAQTMSSLGRPCSISERTLGLGDVLGLEARY